MLAPLCKVTQYLSYDGKRNSTAALARQRLCLTSVRADAMSAPLALTRAAQQIVRLSETSAHMSGSWRRMPTSAPLSLLPSLCLCNRRQSALPSSPSTSVCAARGAVVMEALALQCGVNNLHVFLALLKNATGRGFHRGHPSRTFHRRAAFRFEKRSRAGAVVLANALFAFPVCLRLHAR